MFDVVIVGGSYAGLAAGLQLARARRRVLIVDAGQRRNRFASSSHGFLGQDGQAPEAIAAKGKAEVLAYSTVTWREAEVTEVRADTDGFVIHIGAEEISSRRVILATGVVDELPEVPGLAERWGQTIFHCPYCHGYELDKGRLGVLATGPLSLHQVALAAEWAGVGQMTLFLNGVLEPDEAQLLDLSTRRIKLEREPVSCIEGDAPAVALRLRDNRVITLDGLFAMSRTVIKSPFATQLGCELEAGLIGAYYKTDAMKETTVPGVFACGDNAVMAGGVAFAVADGVRAGVSAHQSLVFRR